MNLKRTLLSPHFAGAIGAAVVLAVGCTLFLDRRPGMVLRFESYDLAYGLAGALLPSPVFTNIVVVFMDEPSHVELEQPFNRPWDRALHARLLDRLTDDGAKVVVFDIVFSDPGPSPGADQAFADAIRRNGHVILAADLTVSRLVSAGQVRTLEEPMTLPYDLFLRAGAKWGLAQLQADEDYVVREHYHGPPDKDYPSLSWATAELLGLKWTSLPMVRSKERWVNYYDRIDVIPGISYRQALTTPPAYFRNQVVFIGAHPMTRLILERRDEFRSPYTSWFKQPIFIPAVNIHATMLQNLLRGDWLRRLPPAVEWGILALAALGLGYGLTRLHPAVALGATVLGLLAFIAGVVLLFAWSRLWFPWLVVVAAQAPTGLLWSFGYHSIEWYVVRRGMEAEQRRADMRIREQAALLDKAQDAIMVHDLAGRITYWNPSAERLYGWPAAEALQCGAEALLDRRDEGRFAEAREAAMAKGDWTGPLRQTTRSGQKIEVESRWTRVLDDAGNPKAILVINTDITEKKTIELQLLRAQRMESIGTLAAGIAHDLNNVLSPILMAVHLVHEREDDERARRLLKTIEASARRGADIVKQVLVFARGQEGERVLLQLKHIAREMDKIVRGTFPKSIAVGMNIDTDLWPIKGDATQLHQLLLNLCVNARDAMPNGGRLSIEAVNVTVDEATARLIHGAKPGPHVALRVTDTGEGIPPEILDRIFEPFFTTKEAGKGTGLGLAMVHKIVQGHEAFLDVASEVGKGTTFTVYFPPAEAGAAQKPAAVAQEGPLGSGQLVLVIDDEPNIRNLAESVLTGRGYRVKQAEDGATGVGWFAQHSAEVAVVVVDLMMPGMDGTATVNAMRQIKPGQGFIVVSGLMQAEEVQRKIGGERLELLPKPFTVEALLNAVRRVVENS